MTSMSAFLQTELGQFFAKALGKALAAARAKRGLSLRQGAKLVGVSHVFLLAVEQGRKSPSNALLLTMAHVFGLDSELVRLIGELHESVAPSPSTFAQIVLKSSSGSETFTVPLEEDTSPKIEFDPKTAPSNCNVKLQPGLHAIMSRTVHAASGQTAAAGSLQASTAPHLASFPKVGKLDSQLLGITILRALRQAGFRARLHDADNPTTSEPGDLPRIGIDLGPGVKVDVCLTVRYTT